MTNRYCTNTSWLPTATGESHLIMGLSGTVIKTETVDDLIVRRERLIESCLSKRYAMPMTQSAAVTAIAEDMVTYDIYSLLFNRDGGVQEKPEIKERYDLALAWLTDLREGQCDLVDDDGSRVPENNVTDKFYISTRGYVQTFDVGNPLSWRVSPGRLESISDAKDADS